MGPCCWKVGHSAVAQARPALESGSPSSWAALTSVTMSLTFPCPVFQRWGGHSEAGCGQKAVSLSVVAIQLLTHV